jgi:hypothetical protein
MKERLLEWWYAATKTQAAIAAFFVGALACAIFF